MVDVSAYEVIMIVHELHQRGYEQLRLFPGISPNGMCWRWMIYPKVLMKDNSFEHHGDCTPFECLRGSTSAAFPEEGQKLKVADDFIKEHEDFVNLAKGEDKAYVEWFEQIVEHAKNKDFPIAFSEFFDAEEWKYTSGEPLAYPPFTPVGPLLDELTEKMHSEFTIDEETEKKHRAGSVWTLLGADASKEEIEHWSIRYGIDYETAMKWKDYWLNLKAESL